MRRQLEEMHYFGVLSGAVTAHTDTAGTEMSQVTFRFIIHGNS